MSLVQRNCVLWDIDGTLVHYDEPTESRFVEYFESNGLKVHVAHPQMVGTTEAGIVSEFLGIKDVAVIQQHLRRLDALWLTERREFARPIVAAARLARRLSPESLQTVVTGNTYLRAVAKLADAGVLSDIDLGVAAFGDEDTDRSNLVRRAISRCRTANPNVKYRFVYIGDTPLDGEAARAVGVPTILVATGKYSAPDLQRLGWGCVIDSLDGVFGRLDALMGTVPNDSV